MTWSEQIAHFQWLASAEEGDIDDYVARRRKLQESGDWQAIDHLGNESVHGFFGNGPAYSRRTVGSMAALLPAATAAYRVSVEGEYPLSTATLSVLDTVCLFEILGESVDASILAGLADLLGRVETSRKDESRAAHWHRGFTALAVCEPSVWRGVAGLMPGPLEFRAGAAFGPNVQGLLAHLAAAIEHRAPLNDVMPAWKTTLAVVERLVEVLELKYETLFWIARIVYHDIGGEPLGRVGERLYADVQQLAAAGL